MQSITITGRLGRDPETRQAGGSSVCNFSVACDNGRDAEPTWYRVGVWGKQGETAQRMLTKGRRVVVQGTLKVSTYEGKTQLDVSATAWEFADSKPEGAQVPPQQSQKQAAPADYGDIPF